MSMTTARPVHRRHLLHVVVAALVVATGLVVTTASLLPPDVVAGTRAAQSDGPDGEWCPVDAPLANFADEAEIPGAHADSVDCAAFFGITVGYSDDTFRPDVPVQRDQMASFIVRTLKAADVTLPTPEEADGFTDVSEDNAHHDDIARAQAAGVVFGGPAGRDDEEYGPELAVRRDQMASYVVRAGEFAYGERFGSDTQYFPDVPPRNVHFENVNFGVENETILGFDAGLFEEDHFDQQFRPRQKTRRDQMASFAARLLRFLTAPVEVAVTGQSPDPPTVGETVTVTATVFTQFRGVADSEGRYVEGEAVSFRAAPETAATPHERVVHSDGDGRADFSFVPHETGTVSVTATIPGPGGAYAEADGDQDSRDVFVEDD